MAGYSITTFEYGFGVNVPMSFYIGVYASDTDVAPIHPFSFTLLQGEDRNILIDTGCNPEDAVKAQMLAGAGIGNLHTAREILATVGLTPEQIDVVILTHCHFDHAGALECFPNAVFYVQEEEYEQWKVCISDKKYTAIPGYSLDYADINRLTELVNAGRVHFLNGDCKDLFPGIDIIKAGFSHSFACQMVVIEGTDGRKYIHTGDIGNRPENLFGVPGHEHYIPNVMFAVGAAYNEIPDYDKILEIADGDLSRIVMTHDGTRRERYPDSIGPLGLGVFKIV